jgi:hypothetical protein
MDGTTRHGSVCIDGVPRMNIPSTGGLTGYCKDECMKRNRDDVIKTTNHINKTRIIEQD